MKCRFCNSSKLTKLISYENYPIFVGCEDHEIEFDKTCNFSIYHCDRCEIIQQMKIAPLEIMYKEQRAFGLGKIWGQHYDHFFRFMYQDMEASEVIAEVGGGNGVLLKKVQSLPTSKKIYDIEPYPYYELDGVHTIKSFFDKHFTLGVKFDLMYSSHLVEHLFDLTSFFEKTSQLLNEDGVLFIATPNISESFENLHLNAFTIDHLNYYTPYTLGKLAKVYGLNLVDYYQYKDHGMYLKFSKKDNQYLSTFDSVDLKEKFYKYKKEIRKFVKHLNKSIGDSPFYLFGGSSFSITFIRHMSEIQVNNLKYILDNEATKENRRLGGGEFIVKNPNIIKSDLRPIVVIYMGAYSNEIIKQLKSINQNVEIYNLLDYL